MFTTELDYYLPPEQIAQTPIEPRDASRLMVVDRKTGTIKHHIFRDLPMLLHPGDLLVANDSRVIPARLYGRKPSGGKVELLLLRRLDSVTWRGLVGGRNVQVVQLPIGGGKSLCATVEQQNAGDADWLIHFEEPVEPYLERVGAMPLPPYIHEELQNPSRYQTVYARVTGSAAAPTAGLHFTPQLIETLSRCGIDMAFVTLNVGLDTFKPIDEDIVERHRIHSEWCELPSETAKSILETRSHAGRIVGVGTTSVRVLETAATATSAAEASAPVAGSGAHSTIEPYQGFTQLYITPGYRYAAVDAIITNFHLPKSTLLAMIVAFMGMELLKTSYDIAIRERYRFYSFGDAMLIQ
jgi:S-adenosylmethionine:tRNA ribosyltransferase-isomerase